MLKATEHDLTGGWILERSMLFKRKMVGDATCKRIEVLIKNYLQEVALGNWGALYLDPNDGRYWELTYPQGEMHGGGPPRLTVIAADIARSKYNIP